MSIQISFNFARIGLDIYKGNFLFTAPAADMNLRQIPAELKIHIEGPRVEIDQEKSMEEIGAGGHMALARKIVRKGLQTSMDYISMIARHGDMLAEIEKNQDALQEVIEESVWHKDKKEINVECIPKTMPRVYVKGSLDIDVIPGGVRLDVDEGKLNIDFDRARVDIYLLQKAKITVETGKNLDVKA
ncbi:hypothetical protein H0A61_02817 [Koleobacter methoxysyntrophicus]|uniref:Uncharacterized protein n=1 Tax=Koleobacter methoxysyntrophicus TaxID=2751313 RepID=A0A8A0RSA2_9FIRM|nr:DUF6470 family protein [Koleobacter methoxysyntrophicus]QSQ10410.1 hypothetical protein H0A61_02817 [Koleobacter methoxysyntrophicus]